MGTYQNASKGLMLNFWAKIITIGITIITALSVFNLHAFVGLLKLMIVVSIACTVMSIIGYSIASSDHQAFKTAFMCSLISGGASVLQSVFNTFTLTSGTKFLIMLLKLVDYIVGYLLVTNVCDGIDGLARRVDNPGLAADARALNNIYKTWTVVMVACAILAYVPLVSLFAAVGSLVAAIAFIYIGIKFIILLKLASNIFGYATVPTSQGPAQNSYSDPYSDNYNANSYGNDSYGASSYDADSYGASSYGTDSYGAPDGASASGEQKEEKKPFVPYDPFATDGESTVKSSGTFKLKD